MEDDLDYLVDWAGKIFDSIYEQVGLHKDHKELFVAAFVSGFLYCEHLEDIIDYEEEQLDLPLH